MISDENLPLRGFLVCPECGRMITGSASKGKYSLYYYYHCVSSCGFRHRADNANDLFISQLKKFVPHPAVVDLSKVIIKQAYQSIFKQKRTSTEQISDEINKLNARLSKARELLLSETIDGRDYKEIKTDCESKIVRLEAQLAEQTNNTTKLNNIDKLLDKAINTLIRIDILYKNGTVTNKRTIISSIYPEKICFDGFYYRTPKMNSVVNYIYQINSNLSQNKNRKSEDFFHLSGQVVPPGIEPGSTV